MNSEARVQSEVRLAVAKAGHMQLWRNNVGAMKDASGRLVRYGLANESKAMSAIIKSADLVGWETITITPDMVGQQIARVLSVECKPEDWTYSPADDHQVAQMRWAELVRNAGGRAIFATSATQLYIP